jgi:hypothetical protein
MKFEIQTHGTSGKWSAIQDCRRFWHETAATTIERAIEVCERIKSDGYGVRLFQDGKMILSAPWQEPVKIGHVVDI